MKSGLKKYQVDVKQVSDLIGCTREDFYLSLFEQPLFLDADSNDSARFIDVTVELLNWRHDGKICGKVRLKDSPEGKIEFLNVYQRHSLQTVFIHALSYSASKQEMSAELRGGQFGELKIAPAVCLTRLRRLPLMLIWLTFLFIEVTFFHFAECHFDKKIPRSRGIFRIFLFKGVAFSLKMHATQIGFE